MYPCAPPCKPGPFHKRHNTTSIAKAPVPQSFPSITLYPSACSTTTSPASMKSIALSSLHAYSTFEYLSASTKAIGAASESMWDKSSHK
ncbi:hypothetical protein C7212DRAFT_336646 [Tuber magnatum]|uniref:Uncharacterized protein n=1 Tax=Tuber magnatum TaxID=42249 RepID=A0A317SCY1_9PEZI|nr:hypothetical protein C7212DRAFT_336646 [Tuber magnatum]